MSCSKNSLIVQCKCGLSREAKVVSFSLLTHCLVFAVSSAWGGAGLRSKTHFEIGGNRGWPRGSGWESGIRHEFKVIDPLSVAGGYRQIRRYGLIEQAATLGSRIELPAQSGLGVATEFAYGSLGMLAPQWRFGAEASLRLGGILGLVPLLGFEHRIYADALNSSLIAGTEFYPGGTPIFGMLRAQTSRVLIRQGGAVSGGKQTLALMLRGSIETGHAIEPSLTVSAGNEGGVVGNTYLTPEVRVYSFYLVGIGMRVNALQDQRMRLEWTLSYQNYPGLNLKTVGGTGGVRWAW